MGEIRRIILASLSSVMDTVEPRKGTCELFGYDFMFSEDPSRPEGFRTWLIEVNSSPAMDYSTEVTLPLVKKVMEDVPKVLFDYAEDPKADTGEWERMYRAESKFETRPPALIGAKLEVLGKRKRKPKPKKKKKKKKKQSKSKVE